MNDDLLLRPSGPAAKSESASGSDSDASAHELIAKEWSGDERSKIHINRLKLRLAFWYPEKYRPVVLNEANVRLVTSTWYVADELWKMGRARILESASPVRSDSKGSADTVARAPAA